MEPIRIKVTEADAIVTQAPTITSGMTGLMAEFEFDAAWEGFTKTAVFKAGDVVRDVVDIGTSCKVPPEVLVLPYRTLRVGVYGVSADGEVVIPTIWAAVDEIKPGADPSGDESTDPTLPVWQQILNLVQQAEKTAAENLTAAKAYTDEKAIVKNLNGVYGVQDGTTFKRLNSKLYDSNSATGLSSAVTADVFLNKPVYEAYVCVSTSIPDATGTFSRAISGMSALLSVMTFVEDSSGNLTCNSPYIQLWNSGSNLICKNTASAFIGRKLKVLIRYVQ